MEPRHERIARIALAAGGRYGLALAGGYAVSAHGMGSRPSGDVDLFTSWQRRGEFPELAAAVIAALESAGYKATVIMSAETFRRLILTDPADGSEEKVELSVDWRAHEPVQLDVGLSCMPTTLSPIRSAPCSAALCRVTSWMWTPSSLAAGTRASNCWYSPLTSDRPLALLTPEVRTACDAPAVTKSTTQKWNQPCASSPRVHVPFGVNVCRSAGLPRAAGKLLTRRNVAVPKRRPGLVRQDAVAAQVPSLARLSR
jgi:hypothetical protein